MKTISTKRGVTVALLVTGLFLQSTVFQCPAQVAPGLPPGVQDVVKLVKAGLEEEVVLAQIRNAAAFYSLSADQLIYLHDQGLSANEIKALLGPGSAAASVNPAPPLAPAVSAPTLVPAPYTPAPAAVVAPTVPAAQPPSLAGFQVQLAAYGAWINLPGYGLCWRPAVAAGDPYWRPYCDQGHWVYTVDGWLWQSDYPWGDVVFHYGRWHRASLGWVWVPAYDWAPAWVCWRHAEGFCGWAPLPPGAVFKPGIGLWFGGHLAVDIDFGLGADLFTFVAYDHFWDHNLRGFLLPRDRAGIIFGRSVVLNGYRIDHGRFVVEGLGRERVASLTRHEIRVEASAYHSGARAREEDRRVPHDDHQDRLDR